MVFYFTTVDPSYVIYMGRDKFENEELIKWGLPTDIWFHVDNLSSAHVYLRLKEGETVDDIPEDVLRDCNQLVKANSIQGCKLADVGVVYTAWSNLKKNSSMAVGQVGFKKSKEVFTVRVKKENTIWRRLEKTKREEDTDFKSVREAYDAGQRSVAREANRSQKQQDKEAKAESLRQAELRSYKSIMVEEKMTSNQDKEYENPDDLDDDFW
eukprot:TRINITY_DN1572_c0_g1_i1.p2 TRINITY_DN1572_c0_g1~~TRINITY_DN1572_c0_g1_i1.p2  ORF type:complete len:219 (-),score=73.52 TRINITY_DN1572_c0_g1_i1:1287-1919(-)